MKLYRSCGTLPIARFYRCVEDDDLRNLIVDFDYENPEIEIESEEDLQLLSETFQEIFAEFNELSENHKLMGILKKRFLINQWKFKYITVDYVLIFYEITEDPIFFKVFDGLDDGRFKFNEEKPIEPQVKKFKQNLKALKNKINIYEIKLNEKLKNVKTDNQSNIQRDLLMLESVLEMSRGLDPEYTSVKQYLILIEMAMQKQKDIKAVNNKSRRHG
jgi:hypothetical protein